MWLAGFRFFELQDVLTLTSTSSTLPPSSVGANQSLLSVATNNNIFGAQVGAKADWRIAPRIRLSAVPKFMIGGNAITNTTELTTVNGSGATFAGGQPVNVHATLGVFSWLGSVDSSVAWDVTDRWSLWVGYRVVGVGNIAQADGQWPSTLAECAPGDRCRFEHDPPRRLCRLSGPLLTPMGRHLHRASGSASDHEWEQ
jgi:hypothetical protein